MTKTTKPVSQSGFTLIEITLAIALMSGVLVGLSWLANQYTGTIKKQAAAQYMINWKEAANKYIKNNSAMIMAGSNASSPYMVATTDLISAGLLSAGTAPLNPYSQTVCAKILQPSPGVLTGLIITNGGQTLGDGDAIDVAASIGTDGGYTAAATPTTASGSYGGWSIPTTTYADCTGAATTAGHLAVALFFNNSNVMSDYVYRGAVTGHPEANTMNTPIQFGTSAVQTSGGACVGTDLGKLSRDTTGHVLMCDGSNWKTQGSAFWQDPVASFAALPACNAAAINQTRVAQTPSVGTGPRAYTCDGTVWQALGVNDSGNITIPGTATMANAAITGTATVGAACAPNGLVAQDGTGLLLSCQSGVWKKDGAVPVFTNVWVGIPMGAVNLGAYLPAGYTAAFITSCGGNSTMDGMSVAYNSLGGASCGAIMASPGTHSFAGNSWFAISGYWK